MKHLTKIEKFIMLTAPFLLIYIIYKIMGG